MLVTTLASVKSYSQNATVDYQAWNPSNPPCNIFAGGINVPATVGGISSSVAHGALYGQPQYNASAAAVELPVEYINSSDTRGSNTESDGYYFMRHV